jgi:hypothetical protein
VPRAWTASIEHRRNVFQPETPFIDAAQCLFQTTDIYLGGRLSSLLPHNHEIVLFIQLAAAYTMQTISTSFLMLETTPDSENLATSIEVTTKTIAAQAACDCQQTPCPAPIKSKAQPQAVDAVPNKNCSDGDASKY